MKLKYKGFHADFELDVEKGFFFGEVINCDDLIAFSAERPQDLPIFLKQSVDTYLKHLRLLGLEYKHEEPKQKISQPAQKLELELEEA